MADGKRDNEPYQKGSIKREYTEKEKELITEHIKKKGIEFIPTPKQDELSRVRFKD